MFGTLTELKCLNCKKTVAIDLTTQPQPDFGTCAHCTPKELFELDEKIIDTRVDAGKEFDIKAPELKSQYIEDSVFDLRAKWIELYNEKKPSDYDRK